MGKFRTYLALLLGNPVTDPTALLETLKERLHAWSNLGRRAQMAAVMPVVDALSRNRVSSAKLAELVTESGVQIQPDALRKALARWRKDREGGAKISGQTGDTNGSERGMLQERSSLPGTQENLGQVGLPLPTATPGIDPSLSVKERLRQIRDMPIDSEKLARHWRKHQAKKKDA